ncbi:amidohydrolase [Sphingomonas gilva]|uniref:amidohydrolase n=1 Tax=Sphingomonas gilva TaxID=2305907 RepID=UPI001FE8F495|nr:amidohydrolase [Sphingomonas gilva]
MALLLATPALADGLIDNVNGITLDEQGRVQRFTGLVIGDDGKVKALLDRRDKRPKELDWREDGRGQTLIPGLIDAHGHVLGLGFQATSLDLSGTKSLAEAQAAIKAWADANPSGSWIVGRGWNQEAWGLGRFPTAADIDAVVPDRPVWLERVDGHAGWANSAALRAAGVTAKSVSPAGGRIEKTAAGAPGGVFVDAAMQLVQKAVPQPLPRERDAALVKAQDILLSSGVTATADMGTSPQDWAAIRRLGDAGGLRIRIFSYADSLDTLTTIAGNGPTRWLYGDRLRMGGVKLYADGALGSRGAWLKAPYADAPKETGLGFLTDDQLQNQMSRAAMDKFQVAIHAIGDRANSQALDAIDELSQTYKGDLRWRIEHAQIVDPVDIPRLARAGTIASMQPVHQTSDWRMAEARLGPNRLVGAYAWRSVLDGGGRLAFGSDYPVENPNPFVGWAVAISRVDAQGQPPGGWYPQQAVTREQALKAFTIDAAYASFAETKVGRLAPGMQADFLLLANDPLLASPGELRAMRPNETWVGGKRMFKR